MILALNLIREQDPIHVNGIPPENALDLVACTHVWRNFNMVYPAKASGDCVTSIEFDPMSQT